MPKSPQNSVPNLPSRCHPPATPLRNTCHPHATPALNSVTPSTARGATRHTPLDLPRTSVLRFPQQRTDLPPAHKTHLRGHLRRTHPLSCTQAPPARPRRTPVLSRNVPKRSRFGTPAATPWDSPPATKCAQWCTLEHISPSPPLVGAIPCGCPRWPYPNSTGKATLRGNPLWLPSLAVPELDREGDIEGNPLWLPSLASYGYKT